MPPVSGAGLEGPASQAALVLGVLVWGGQSDGASTGQGVGSAGRQGGKGPKP